MESIIYAAPIGAGNAPVEWPGLSMRWIGWDDTVWDLTSGISGLALMPGLRGIHMPPTKHYKDNYPTLHGARWRGYNIEQREVFWPIQIFNDYGSQEWLNHDKKFWRTMSPHKTGVWEVIQPNGTVRSLRLRYRDDGQYSFDLDPAIVGWNNYGLMFDAEQPFWTEPEVTRSFRSTSPAQFFSPGGAVVNITAGSTISSATLFNPGDEKTYPVWELEGPITSATISLDGNVISVPFAVPTGQKLTIDTNPETLMATMNGVDMTPQLGTAQFFPLPVGDVSSLALTVVGSGNISVRFTPLYYRAW